MENQLPLAVRHLRVPLAHASFPMIVTPLPVAPQRVNVHHREGRIIFLRDLDFTNLALVVNQLVGLEQLLPACPPTLTIVSS